MIKLFDIPNRVLDTSNYNHILNGSIVDEFTENFCKYVGAKYGCPTNSATNAISLVMTEVDHRECIRVPTMLPPVVVNAIVAEYPDRHIIFEDDPSWVGGSYILTNYFSGKGISNIWDFAQEVSRDCYGSIGAAYKSCGIFSFYPTKPVSGIDGGMIVSDDKDLIDRMKVLSMNGMSNATNSWDRKLVMPGYKSYMSSIQADFANQSLQEYDSKIDKLNNIRKLYNDRLGYDNVSNHLYRINLNVNNRQFIQDHSDKGIQFGIHYEPIHWNKEYLQYIEYGLEDDLSLSEEQATSTLSIPFHEKLTQGEIDVVCKTVEPFCRG